jgi:hypothetical protein
VNIYVRMYTLVSVMEDADSDHPVMLRHPMTGRLVNVDLNVVLDVTWHYMQAEDPDALLRMPYGWLRALLSYKDEILRRGEENLRRKHPASAVDLSGLLGQMSLR